MGKGSRRRQEDNSAVRERWPLAGPEREWNRPSSVQRDSDRPPVGQHPNRARISRAKPCGCGQDEQSGSGA